MSTTAMLMVGKPYLWGANGADAFDCSGLCIEIARSAGIDVPRDMTATDLFGWLSANHKTSNDTGDIREGDFVFFGKESTGEITHVGYAICKDFMVEAGGGGRATTAIAVARKKGAMVRIRPIKGKRTLLHAVAVFKE